MNMRKLNSLMRNAVLIYTAFLHKLTYGKNCSQRLTLKLILAIEKFKKEVPGGANFLPQKPKGTLFFQIR